jgi:hypothetical protein
MEPPSRKKQASSLTRRLYHYGMTMVGRSPQHGHLLGHLHGRIQLHLKKLGTAGAPRKRPRQLEKAGDFQWRGTAGAQPKRASGLDQK